MARAIVLFAEGFEEIEALAIVDVLRRGSVDTTTLSIANTDTVTGAHGIEVCVDAHLSDLPAFDMVVLPGGLPGATNLAKSDKVQCVLRQAKAEGKFISAICAAPIALEAAGVLDNNTITCYPGFEEQIDNATYTGNRVEKDGKLTTGAGPGAAIEFGLALLEQLGKADTAAQLRTGMLVK